RGLVVEHPVADIIVALFGEEVGRRPGLGQAGAEPAARGFAGGLADRRRGAPDVVALVGDLLHVLLRKAVTDELPLPLARRLDDRAVAGDRRAVDREDGWDAAIVEHFEHAPEADPVAVFVPGPVRDVGHWRAARRRGQDG